MITTSPKTTLKNIFRIALLSISLAYILYFFIKNKETFKVTFSMDWKILTVIIILQFVYFVLQSWRFQIVMEKCSGIRLPFYPWLRLFIQSRFLNVLFSQAGNIYRGIQLKNNYGISYTRYVSGYTSMAWLDTLMNLIIAILVVAVLNPALEIGQLAAWKILTLLLAGFLGGPILAEVIFKKIKLKHHRLIWIHNKLSEILHVTVNNLRDFPFLCKTFGIGILLFIRTILVFHLYFTFFGNTVSLPTLAIFYTLFKLSFFVILTPGNLGVQEIAWGFLSEQMNVGMGQGILMSGFVRIISTTVLIAAGLAFGGTDLIRERKKYVHQSVDDKNLFDAS